MGWNLRTNIRGPRGLQGDPGLPGVNAVPADNAVGAYAASKTSETFAGIRAGFATRAQTAAEFNEDFAQYTDGNLPSRALSGQAFSELYATPDARIRVDGGFASFGEDGELGGYATVELDRDVVRMGGQVTFTPYSAGGGLACWAATEEDIAITTAASEGIPRMAAHLTLSPEAVNVDVCTVKGGSVTNVGGYVFPAPLAADDSTLHQVELVIDKKRERAYLSIPGEDRWITLSHPAFGLPARFTYFEPFRSAGTPWTKTQAKFRRTWADSRDVGVVDRTAPLTQVRSQAKRAESALGSDLTLTLTGTPSLVAAVDPVTFTYPQSGAVLVEASGLLDVTANGPVHLALFDASDALIAVETVATKTTHSGTARAIFALSGTPGEQATVKLGAYLGGSAAAQLIIGQASSPDRWGRARLIVTDVRG